MFYICLVNNTNRIYVLRIDSENQKPPSQFFTDFSLFKPLQHIVRDKQKDLLLILNNFRSNYFIKEEEETKNKNSNKSEIGKGSQLRGRGKQFKIYSFHLCIFNTKLNC